MPKSWRWIAPIAVAGGLIASGTIPAAEASSAAVASISINATSPNYPGLRAKDHGKVDGFALVIYKTAGAGTATISGNVTESTGATDTATLMAEPFGKTQYTAVGSPVSLTPGTNGVAPYSFLVTPSLRTHYKVRVQGTDSGTSTPVTVYVSVAAVPSGKSVHVKCTRTRCVETVKVFSTLPAKAFRTESRKHVFLYLAIGELRSGKPRLPKNYTLSTASHASKARRINSGKYVETLTWIVPIRNSRTIWVPNACVKDTVTTDGLGLPGHHGCGNRHVPRSAIYLG
jgi:hypothetical protein